MKTFPVMIVMETFSEISRNMVIKLRRYFMYKKCSTNHVLRRMLSVILTLAMIISTFCSFDCSVSAAVSSKFSSTYYKTNPNGAGKNASITIDGKFDDWNSSMLIAQGVANDDARAFRGTHEGPVYDTYALYAAWDNDNVYFMWEFTNVTDVVDPAQSYPISDNGKPSNGDIPQVLALDVNPNRSGNGMIGTKGIWGIGLNYENGVDTVLSFSSKPGVGTPAIFTLNDNDEFSYTADCCTAFKTAGIKYAYGDGHISDKIYGIKANCYEGYTPADLASDSSNWVDMMENGHDAKQDTMYEMSIPFSALGIDKNYLETNGIGAMHISTFGQSGITSIPADDSMIDNAAEPYSCDESTSAEKEDTDIITCELARVGSGSIPTIAPTTSATTAPSIQPTTTATIVPTVTPTTTATVAPSPTYVMPPMDPVADEVTATSVTLKAVSGVVYKMNDGNWQSSPVFTGLKPETTYYFYEKYPATSTTQESPVSSALAVTTLAKPDSNTATIYYKTSDTAYMHYRIGSSEWTVAPGKLMESSDYAGYKVLTVNLGTDTALTACFNNGNGNWDNNGNQNYSFGTGTYTVSNGKITNSTPVVSNNKVTLYYKTNWSNAYVHYKAGSGSWTVAPGRLMSDSEVSGYKKITIDLDDETTMTACFNNGNGNWDSNGSSNYYIMAPGTYTVANGTVTSGAPTMSGDNSLTIYYYAANWSDAYCHYKVGTGAWTAVPGVKMEKEGSSFVITINLGTETNATVCFNNGNGSWDSNNSANYYFSYSGTYVVENGNISELLYEKAA